MNYLRGAVSAISAPYQYYKELAPLNPSTLTGAIDVIVISRPKPAQNSDGRNESQAFGDDKTELICSPFHVRFGKWQVLRPADKKVNVFVNGKPVPFSMKIGDAGEAFFVFETDEHVPEDLVTSPLLEATKPGELDVELDTDGQFAAHEVAQEAAVESHGEPPEVPDSAQEPDFLDLDAIAKDEGTVPSTAYSKPSTSGVIPERPSSMVRDESESGRPLSLLSRTAELGKALVGAANEIQKSETDKLRDMTLKHAMKGLAEEERHVVSVAKDLLSSYTLPLGTEKGDEALPDVDPDQGKGPEVLYGEDMVFDMDGYHSHARDGSTKTITRAHHTHAARSTSSSSSQISASADRTPGPSRSPSPEPSSSSSYNIPIPFPTIRATSEPPPDVSDLMLSTSAPSSLSRSPPGIASKRASKITGLGSSSANASALRLAVPPETEEYSWEWGSFPQKTPIRAVFPSIAGEVDGDARISGWKGKGRMPSGPQDGSADGRPFPSVEEKKRSKLSQGMRNDADASVDLERTKKETKFGNGGRLTVDRGDPTRFRLFIEGRTLEFELSLVPQDKKSEGDGKGRLGGFLGTEDELEDARRFEECRITFTRFLEDEQLVKDDNLVLRLAGDKYITRQDGSPLMDALVLWREAALRSTGIQTSSRAPSRDADERARRRRSMDPEGVLSSDEGTTLSAKGDTPNNQLAGANKPSSSSWVRWWSRSRRETDAERPELRPVNSAPPGLATTNTSETEPIGLQPMTRAATAPETPSDLPLMSTPARVRLDSEVMKQSIAQKPRKRFAKTLRLTSDQLKALELKPGTNTITFSLSATGVAACSARVFVWDHTDRIVISDIDGTITKSDALGHVFTMIGRDWTHLGVAKLYTDICRNGYKMLYLTSRAIGQADSTRDYLKGIRQNDYVLPEGPVIMSPDRLMASLHREVIMRKPQVFKMACLRDIQRLFGPTCDDPFHAGFGNRITDALSYRSVNVPPSRIFTIDSRGEVKMELLEVAGYKSSYIHMTDLVDHFFPPINRKWEAEYTDLNYWKTPIQDFPLPDLAPPSPALSARSDTSNQSALARLRNFSLVGGRQTNIMRQTSLPAPATGASQDKRDEGRRRDAHLRQMSSLERLGSRLASLTQSSSSTMASPGSTTSTYLDSGSEDDDDDDDHDVEKGRRGRRRRSISSMPGSLPGSTSSDEELHFEVGDGDDYEGEQGYGYDGENEEEAAEDAFDEDFLATGEMKDVPFL